MTPPFDLTTRATPPYTKYGVTLCRLEHSDLELVRSWRNSEEIAQVMIYRETITAEMQAAWFASIDNANNFYSLVIHAGVPIGMSHVKNVDHTTMSGEGGMMIWSREHQNSIVPFRAAVAGTDWMFFIYGLKRLHGRVLASNKRALRYNRALGYVFDGTDNGGEVLTGHLTPELYSAKVDPMRPILLADST
ncbi:MAG: GNAT family N-acetyltransferase [Polyangiaceae bacterium]